MKNKKMAMLFALTLTLSLVWGINEEARADASCEHPRCHTVGNICLPGHAISFRQDCSDNLNNLACELQAPCNLFPPVE